MEGVHVLTDVSGDVKRCTTLHEKVKLSEIEKKKARAGDCWRSASDEKDRREIFLS